MTKKTAVVAGGSSGIGAASRLRLADAGWNLVINHRTDDEAAEKTVLGAMVHGVSVIRDRADGSDSWAVASLFDAAVTEFGAIDAVVSSAGTLLTGLIAEVSDTALSHICAVDITGTSISCGPPCGE